MDSDVLAFIIVDLHRDLGLGLAFGQLDVSLDDVVLGTRRNALCEFATVIGDKFPFYLLVGGAPDLNGDSCNRSVVRAPDGANDEGIIPRGRRLLRRGLRREERRGAHLGAERHKQEHRDACECHNARAMRESGLQPYSSSSSSATSSSSASSSSTRLNSSGSTATTSKSVPHSGQETTSPSSSSMSRSLSHSGQITMANPSDLSTRHAPRRITARATLLYLESLATSVK